VLLRSDTDAGLPSTIPVAAQLPQLLWERFHVRIRNGEGMNAVICDTMEAHLARMVAQGGEERETAHLAVHRCHGCMQGGDED
jgi:hypothetical protein